MVFVFQAEDGIRDWTVTGVQTCALPICSGLQLLLDVFKGRLRKRDGGCAAPQILYHGWRHEGAREPVGLRFTLRVEMPCAGGIEVDDRSEERRVGKECRSRWSPYH